MTQKPIIDFRNCTIFQKDHLVLKDVSFTVDPGEFVYLIGRVGSGKTSLIKTINAQLPLHEGFARVGEFTLRTIKQREIPVLRRTLGIVFQDFQLLSDRTVHANLEFVLRATGWKDRKKTADRIREVLDMVDLGLKGYKMPHQLSGGEQQRVVIARALLNNPQIILADEPTGNLDPETSSGILGILKEISSNGQAVIIATHNYNLLKQHQARTMRCENGRLTEMNRNEEIDFETIIN
ncbi:MAG: ATP-binding cassette domain-containing protein [Chlorobi bacterium]|nr:ATP-binding cassette domain-containing protein [Chlorobiota bacterium]